MIPSSNVLGGGSAFASTHWSVVLRAGDEDSTKATEALSYFCRTYWYPLYAYVRRKGYSAPDAQDLTQEFFARLLARNYLNVADRNRGRFRSFLLGSFEHFLAREWKRAHAQKRGTQRIAFSFDEIGAEERYRVEPADHLSPEKIYDRRWATTVLEQAMARLREECAGSGKGDLFRYAQDFLSGDKDARSYAELAACLKMSEGAAKVAVHRLRRRYGELVRVEIQETVTSAEQAEEELRYLFAVLRE